MQSSKQYNKTKGPIHVCFYHGSGCKDGSLSKYLVEKYNQEEFNYQDGLYVPCEPGKTNQVEKHFGEISNKNVAVVDITFAQGYMKKISDSCESIIILDHHKTGLENCEGLDKDLYIINPKFSASHLVFESLFPETKIPNMINYIDDEDTGMVYNNTKTVSDLFNQKSILFCNFLKSKPVITNEDWYNLLINDALVESVIDNEKLKTEPIIKQVEEITSNALTITQNVNGANLQVSYWPINKRFNLINFVGTALRFKGSDIICGTIQNDDGTFKHSLRGSPDIDLSILAKSIDPNGGGHFGASSCTCSSDILPFSVIGAQDSKE